jgi:hypothetical protein
VAVDGPLGDEQARSDLLVAQTLGDQPRDVGFPLRQRRHARIVWSRGDDMSRLPKRRSDCGVPAQALSGVELGLEA